MDESVTVAGEGGARVGEEAEGRLFQFEWWDHAFRLWTVPESVLHITWMKYQTKTPLKTGRKRRQALLE